MNIKILLSHPVEIIESKTKSCIPIEIYLLKLCALLEVSNATSISGLQPTSILQGVLLVIGLLNSLILTLEDCNLGQQPQYLPDQNGWH